MWDFPSAPTNGQTFVPVPGITYTFNGVGWTYSNVNPAPLSIAILLPAFMLAGGPDMTMRVPGLGFTTASLVYMDGTPLVTTFASSESLQAVVPASAETAPRIAQITARNGTIESNALPLQFALAPTLASFTPTSLSIAAGPVQVTYTGTNFVQGSVVLLNFNEMPTTFVSATQLTAMVTPLGTPGDSLYTEVHTGALLKSNQLLMNITA